MSKTMTPFAAMQSYTQSIDKTIALMNQPAQANKTAEHRVTLKKILKEAIENFQKSLMVVKSGGAGLIQQDPIGFTIAKTAYSHPDAVAKNKYSALVDELCKEILDEQQAASEANGNLISEQNILAAQTDATNPEKENIDLVSNLVDSGKVDEKGNAIFEQSHLEVNKETGDTIVNERTVTKDKDGNIYTVDKDDVRLKTGELVGITKGIVVVRDKDNNIFPVLKTDPRYVSGELVFYQKDMVKCFDKDGNKLLASPKDPRFKTGELIKKTQPKSARYYYEQSKLKKLNK